VDEIDGQRPVVTIGGQEVLLDAAREATSNSVGHPDDIRIALEPVAERVVYQVDRVPGQWEAGLTISVFALAGLGAVLALALLIRWMLRKRE
jgi:hypothetical protein